MIPLEQKTHLVLKMRKQNNIFFYRSLRPPRVAVRIESLDRWLVRISDDVTSSAWNGRPLDGADV